MNNRPFIRGGSKASATSKIELCVIIGNGFEQDPKTASMSKMELFVIKSSTLDVAVALDPPLVIGLLFTIHPIFVNKV